MIDATNPPVTTGRGAGEAMPRRAIEEQLKRQFPKLTSSQANKIARRNRTLESALSEAAAHQRGFVNGIPRSAYRGHDATPNTALHLLSGGAA